MYEQENDILTIEEDACETVQNEEQTFQNHA